MSGNEGCTVYIGYLDDRVSDRVLYDILIQAGRVVDLYIPRCKETDKPKGFAFAEYETKEIADYAVRLFTGVVTLYNRTLKFAISGQDKPSPNLTTVPIPSSSLPLKQRLHPVPINNMEISQRSTKLATTSRFSSNPVDYSQVPVPSRIIHQNNGYGSGSHVNSKNYEYSRRIFGATLDSINRSSSGRFDTSNPISYPSY